MVDSASDRWSEEGTPCYWVDHTGPVAGHRRHRIQSAVVMAGRRSVDKPDLGLDVRQGGHRHFVVPEQPASRQHVVALPRLCAHFPPPSFGPSTLFGSP